MSRCCYWELIFILATILGVLVQFISESTLYVLDIRVLSIAIAIVSATRLGWRFGKWLEKLHDTVVFLPEIFEFRDAQSYEPKAKRPLRLKKFLPGLIELSLRFDPAIERFGSGEHFVCVELVFQRDGAARPSSTFHVVFELGRDVLELLQYCFLV